MLDSTTRATADTVDFSNSLLVKVLACLVGTLLTIFNVILLVEVASGRT
jgi:hypothetical protein